MSGKVSPEPGVEALRRVHTYLCDRLQSMRLLSGARTAEMEMLASEVATIAMVVRRELDALSGETGA